MTDAPRLTSLAHGGGCACKIPPGELEDVLTGLTATTSAVGAPLLVGLAMDGTILLVPAPDALAAQIPLMVAAVVLNGAATGLYISARFGPPSVMSNSSGTTPLVSSSFIAREQ